MFNIAKKEEEEEKKGLHWISEKAVGNLRSRKRVQTENSPADQKKEEHNRNVYGRTQYGRRAAGPDKLSFVVAGRAGGKREAGDSASGAREGGSCRVEWTSEIVVERLGSAETLTLTRSPAVLQTSARLLSETKTSQRHPRTSPTGVIFLRTKSFKSIKIMF